MRKHATSPTIRKRIVPVILAAALVVGGLSGAAAAAANRAGNGRQASMSMAATAGQRAEIAQECVLDPAPLGSEQLVLSLEGYGAAGALVDEDLTIADMLAYAIQDEYLAHGEYEAIIAEYGSIRPYTNIMRSEETHIAALSRLYDAYGIEIPADDSSAHLVIPTSLLEAAETGVKAEIDNIAMYDEFLAQELPQEVQSVFESLRDASTNHLRAYERQVERLTS